MKDNRLQRCVDAWMVIYVAAFVGITTYGVVVTVIPALFGGSE